MKTGGDEDRDRFGSTRFIFLCCYFLLRRCAASSSITDKCSIKVCSVCVTITRTHGALKSAKMRSLSPSERWERESFSFMCVIMSVTCVLMIATNWNLREKT